MQAVRALKDAGLEVKGLVAIFTYGFDLSMKNFANAECPFITLTDYDHLIDQALKSDYVTASDVDSLREWKINPENWKN
ncbi:Orotate phosphoribosyltransferase [compost metagenome]